MLLADVDASRAAARPLPGAHSIWELVQHMTVWLETVRRRLEENRAIEPAPEVNWALVPDPSEEAWRRTVERHRRAAEDLRRLTTSLQDSRLEQGVAGKDYDAYVMLHGIVQHELYHAGQIALLKKVLR
ncbi:MAG TPA: DinB family protein [Thermoanaerobaculia bacterium]|nr:DinB family protein [Thermoanaerobaculia bacterium]